MKITFKFKIKERIKTTIADKLPLFLNKLPLVTVGFGDDTERYMNNLHAMCDKIDFNKSV
ncbi:hypothetical protein J7J26_02275 [Candidatus Micrarchaeota archaeon]|nr:hypothetical protein [Candidatus Micrarchaeota archaeon]